MIYFTADTHFFHANVIEMCRRPFRGLYDMHESLISNWNSVVQENDSIYILGDFAFKGSGSDVNNLLRRLNGTKHLIVGNHDKYLKYPDFDSSLFESVQDYLILSYNKIWFILFHYPILEWAHYYRKSIHLFGHVHNNISHRKEESEKFSFLGSRAVNVGVDVQDFYPVSAEKLINQIYC